MNPSATVADPPVEKITVDREALIARVRESFARVEPYGAELTAWIYAHFFDANPRYRKYFSGDPAKQHEAFLGAMRRIIGGLDRLELFLPYLRELALDHRKYGLRAAHYDAMGESIVAAVAHFSGAEWDDETADAWRAGYGLVADVMLATAQDADSAGPRYWECEVAELTECGVDVVRLVLTVDQGLTVGNLPYEYRAGQYAAVELNVLPRVWRDLSFATAPRPDGRLEFHVQRTSETGFSAAVHDQLSVGDRVRVAPAKGELAFPAAEEAGRLLAVVSGTGLAPVIALVEEAIEHEDSRPIAIVAGTLADYLRNDLEALLERHGAAHVVYAVDGRLPGALKKAFEAIGGKEGEQVGAVVVGSAGTVTAAKELLHKAGVDEELISSDLF